MTSYEFTSYGITVLYIVSAVLSLLGMHNRADNIQTKGCVLAAAAFFLQTATLFMGIHKHFADGLSGGAYIQMVAWFVGLASLILWLTFHQRSAISFASPLCGLLFLLSLPYLTHALALPASLTTSFYVLHIGFLFVSLALMAISCIVSALFLFLERRIKRKQRVAGLFNDMPALHILDKINGICICTIFPFYTIGIISGLLRTKPIYGSTLTGDPKEIFSLVIVGLLAFVFHHRIARSWTGKKPAIAMLCIFLLSLFSLLIINTVMDSHHAFTIN